MVMMSWLQLWLNSKGKQQSLPGSASPPESVPYLSTTIGSSPGLRHVPLGTSPSLPNDPSAVSGLVRFQSEGGMAAEWGGSPLPPPGLCTHPRKSAWSRNVWVSIIPPPYQGIAATTTKGNKTPAPASP